MPRRSPAGEVRAWDGDGHRPHELWLCDGRAVLQQSVARVFECHLLIANQDNAS